jgi:hypothetical protein
MTSTSALVEQVLSGTNRSLQLMAAGGVLPVPANELIPLQIRLARSADEEIAYTARTSLRNQTPNILANFLAEEASQAVLTFFALEVDEPIVLQTILQRRDVSRSLLKAIAPSLAPELQEILLLRQDAIVEEPEILDALGSNPHLSLFARRRIAEYREHLIPREVHGPAFAPVQEATEEEAQASIAEVREIHPDQGEVEDHTGLTEMQIRLLPVPVRMRLTRGASPKMRAILVRDPNPNVAVACFAGNKFNDREVEQICHNRNSHEEILALICRNRQWMARYAIIAALTRNPRTPIGIAVRLVPRLSVRDLRDLRRDRNVPDPVRKTADRLYKIKVK